MDNTTKILIIIIIVLVGVLGVTSGILLQGYLIKNNNSTINQSNSSINNTTQTTATQNNTQTVSPDSNSGQNSDWIARTCPRCGKTFYVPVHGEQLSYCDDCANDILSERQ